MDVLVVRAGALGDVLLLRRAVGALRSAGHRVHLLAPGRVGRVLVGPGPAGASGLTDLDGPRVAAWLGGDSPGGELSQSLRADAVLALTRSSDLVARLGEVAPRVLPRDPSPPPRTHASHWLAAPVRDLGADPTRAPPALVFTRDEHGAAQELLARLPRRFLAVHPGSGSATKNWPVDRFGTLIRARAEGRPWLLVSGPAEDATAPPLTHLPGAVPAHGLPLRVLGALLGQSGLYVGNDSGVTHLAAAAGAPTLALFGPTDAAVWSPVGPLVETVSSTDATMEGLDVVRVQAAAQRLLARTTEGFRCSEG